LLPRARRTTQSEPPLELLLTKELGHRTIDDAIEAQRREVDQLRFTSLDRVIQRQNPALVIRGAPQQSDFLQRIPIPIAMWTPGTDKGVPLRLDGAGTLRVAGRKGAILICYEQLLIWPVITSFKEHPSVLIGIANDYWARTTTVPDIQRASLKSWARLFHVPMLWAENT